MAILDINYAIDSLWIKNWLNIIDPANFSNNQSFYLAWHLHKEPDLNILFDEILLSLPRAIELGLIGENAYDKDKRIAIGILKPSDKNILEYLINPMAHPKIDKYNHINLNNLQTTIYDEDNTSSYAIQLAIFAKAPPILLKSRVQTDAYSLKRENILKYPTALKFTYQTHGRVPSEILKNSYHVDDDNMDVNLYTFSSQDHRFTHYAFVIGDLDFTKTIDVRIHSECFTGDLLASMRCDCQSQLHIAMQYLKKNNGGVIFYTAHEGRGIGLNNKMMTYQLQDLGLDTYSANRSIGFHDDERLFSMIKDMIDYFEIKSVNLLTNNPRKINALKGMNIEVKENIPVSGSVNDENKRYLQEKKSLGQHKLDI